MGEGGRFSSVGTPVGYTFASVARAPLVLRARAHTAPPCDDLIRPASARARRSRSGDEPTFRTRLRRPRSIKFLVSVPQDSNYSVMSFLSDHGSA